MNLEKIKKFIGDQPNYRIDQIKKAIFQDLIKNWDEATTLSLDLRKKLASNFPLEIDSQLIISEDKKTIKGLITLEDNFKIETVLMRYENRNTVCVSSQVGCPLNCAFCATGKHGFKRNLSHSEIIDEVLLFARFLKEKGEKVTNIVFMGMGEPFLNYDNVLKAIEVLNDKDGFNLGIRSFSISTSGIIEGIEKLSEEGRQINLAISLNAPNNDLRSKLMPINKKYPLNQLLTAVDKYIEKSRRKVMFEYIMIRDVNDTNEHAKELLDIVKDRFCVVNLIPCNPIGEKFQPSPKERIQEFRKILKKKRVAVTQRYLFGRKISAACGQLAGKN